METITLTEVLETIENRMKEKHIQKRYLAEIFNMTYKGVWAWFDEKVIIPSNKLIKLIDLVDAEIIIRDKNTHEIICGNVSKQDLRNVKNQEQICEVKKALSVLSDFLKD